LVIPLPSTRDALQSVCSCASVTPECKPEVLVVLVVLTAVCLRYSTRYSTWLNKKMKREEDY